jgi:hypothetical protein
MPMSQPKQREPAETESRPDDLVKRIRKLRWMGMEDEAERLQQELTRRCADGDTVVGTPRETD